jgi:hypothetical protein
MNEILIYIGGATALLWGVTHLFPTRNVVKGFGEITLDNQRIITMEWIVEGATLIFLGALTFVITIVDPTAQISRLVYWFIAGMLVVLAVISLFTGFKINFLPYKLCPLIFTLSAVLILLGMSL